jgi:hypothetical protein
MSQVQEAQLEGSPARKGHNIETEMASEQAGSQVESNCSGHSRQAKVKANMEAGQSNAITLCKESDLYQ